MNDVASMIWDELQAQINGLKQSVTEGNLRSERSEISDSIPAYTLAAAPLAAQGGLGDGLSYITLAWISNGRKSGEGVGAGTGILAFYNTATDSWFGVRSEVAVTV